MPPPTNRSLKQGQAEQGQVEQAKAKYVDDHTKDERAKTLFTPKGFAGNPPIFTPIPSIPSPTAFQECIEGIAKTNKRVVVSLARQKIFRNVTQKYSKVMQHYFNHGKEHST